MGTAVPHLRSRVMQRGFKPSRSHELVICLVLLVQTPRVNSFSRYALSSGSSCGGNRGAVYQGRGGAKEQER